MWKKIQDSPLYFIRFIEENGYEIYITDYISIWTVKFTSKDFLQCLEDSNKGFEYNDVNDFLRTGCTMLNNPENLYQISLEKKDKGNILEMYAVIDYPLRFKCKLTKESDQFFCSKITIPFLKIIQDLCLSQSEMADKLKKKGFELEAYKSKTKGIPLISLKTEEFKGEETHIYFYSMFGELKKPQTMIKNIVDKLIEAKQDIESNIKKKQNLCVKTESKMNGELLSVVKTEPRTYGELTNESTSSGTMDMINSDNIKREIVDTYEMNSGSLIKRPRKKLSL